MPGCIAVLNAGSSSIKFALYEAGYDGDLLFRGQIENIGQAPHLKVVDATGAVVAERRWTSGALDHHAATAEIMKVGRELLAGRRSSPSGTAWFTAAPSSPSRRGSTPP
jgi:acetate kinase